MYKIEREYGGLKSIKQSQSIHKIRGVTVSINEQNLPQPDSGYQVSGYYKNQHDLKFSAHTSSNTFLI